VSGRAQALHQIFPQHMLAEYQKATSAFNREFIKKNLGSEEQALYQKIRDFAERRYESVGDNAFLPVPSDVRDGGSQYHASKAMARQLIKARASAIHGPMGENFFGLGKAGVSTSLGFNFYDLRGPVQFLYPVNTPFRNTMPRFDRVNDGWGVAAHWQATRNPGTPYAGAVEGQRVSVGTPDDNPYIASYKELGMERSVTFTAQAAGEGFTDNVADEHIRGLHSLYLQEESFILMGNSGTGSGSNGYQLGTCPTPTLTQSAGASSFTTANTVYVACVALTPLGYPSNSQYGYNGIPSVTGGLSPTFIRTNADGTTDTLNGGTSQISALSTGLAIATNGNVVTATVGSNSGTGPGVEGATAYAWYVGTGGTAATTYLYAITTVPVVVISAAGSSSNQAANATGLSADHSNQTLDFDGLRAYSQNAGGIWKSQYGQGPSGSASLTPGKDGTIVEFENILETLATTYQAQCNKIYCGAQARLTIDQCMKYGGANGQPFVTFISPDQGGNLRGGFVFTAYQSKWAGSGGNGPLIPIEWHPMLPPGTIMFDITENPYPHSRVPFVRGLLVQRDYYSIEWPLVSRNWQFGTYVHEVLAHYVPWITAFIDFVGPFVGN
jgi:hypothetical protein